LLILLDTSGWALLVSAQHGWRLIFMRFILGVLIGIGVGVCAGLLTATRPGTETRRRLSQRMRSGAEDEE